MLFTRNERRVVCSPPGGGMNGVTESPAEMPRQNPLLRVRHEEAAIFIACERAKDAGKPGVASVPLRA